MKNIGFISLGCAKNLTDTETMLGILTDGGFGITADPTEAQVLVVNTCAFIDSAKEESINAILEMAQYKQDKCELLVVTGCLAQRYKEDIERELTEVDIILGTSDYDKIADVIKEFYQNGNKNSFVGSADRDISENLKRVRTTPSYSAYLKIADGCDNHCTYCIIPKLRGKFRSRSEDSILNEAKLLAKEGVKELILVAQDTAYYGKDKGEYKKLAQLIKKLSMVDGIEWIRLQYCYPENITDELIDEIANNPKVVKYIDMPLQHVSDNVLKRMGRKSRKAEIEELVQKLRSKIDGVVIRTSLITGFPGETEEDFNELMEFGKKYKLDKVGVFAYSKEEGTPAYNYDNQVDSDTAQKRADQFMLMQREVSKQINQAKIGKTVTVIVEGYDEGEFCYVGRTSTDTPDVDGLAYIYSEQELTAGEILDVQVIDCDEYDIITKI